MPRSESLCAFLLLSLFCNPYANASAAPYPLESGDWYVISAVKEEGNVVIVDGGISLHIPKSGSTSSLASICRNVLVSLSYSDNTITLSPLSGPPSCSHATRNPEKEFVFDELLKPAHSIAHSAEIASLDHGKIVLRRRGPIDLPPISDHADRVSLLSQYLVDLEPNDAGRYPDRSIALFTANQTARLPDYQWQLRFPSQTVTLTSGSHTMVMRPTTRSYAGNQQDNNWHVASERRDDVPPFAYRSTSYTFQWTGKQNPTNPDPRYIFAINGSLTIPSCAFDSLSNPTCYPSVTITNEALTRDNIILRVTQPGQSTPKLIEPQQKASFDRSLGNVTVELGEIITRSFYIRTDVRPSEGPAIGITPFTQDRMQTYQQLAELHRQLSPTTTPAIRCNSFG
jgi:hypothetical protein